MKKLLVIDDDEGIREAFELALTKLPIQVTTADCAVTGIAAAARERPDLIILDLKMPEIDGTEALRRLLARDPGLKICILTAFAAEFMQPLQQAADAGLNFDLVRKPLSAEQIREVISAMLALPERVR
jgi:two-component system nitrogen regulation response regulator GlnG